MTETLQLSGQAVLCNKFSENHTTYQNTVDIHVTDWEFESFLLSESSGFTIVPLHKTTGYQANLITVSYMRCTRQCQSVCQFHSRKRECPVKLWDNNRRNLIILRL